MSGSQVVHPAHRQQQRHGRAQGDVESEHHHAEGPPTAAGAHQPPTGTGGGPADLLDSLTHGPTSLGDAVTGTDTSRQVPASAFSGIRPAPTWACPLVAQVTLVTHASLVTFATGSGG